MTVDYQLIIESKDEPVDMKSGLTSMQGVSDAVRSVGEAVLTGKVPERKNHKSSVRTTLKNSFKGSYGHKFSLDISDPDLLEKFRSIGPKVFSEIISYFIGEALYKDVVVSDSAQAIIDSMSNISEKITEILRMSPLKNAHDVTEKFYFNVKIEHEYNRDTKSIAYFDSDSAKTLRAKRSKDQKTIEASITRFNILTGNGRLQLKNADETVAFGFDAKYRDIRIKLKDILLKNMSENNIKGDNEWLCIKLVVQAIEVSQGRVVKYIIKGFHEK